MQFGHLKGGVERVGFAGFQYVGHGPAARLQYARALGYVRTRSCLGVIVCAV